MTLGPGELLAVGFEGTALPEDVLALAADAGLGGIVLFTRNCPTLDAVLALTGAARTLGPDVLVLVDHEGGRVHRLPSHCHGSANSVLPPSPPYSNVTPRRVSNASAWPVRACGATGTMPADDQSRPSHSHVSTCGDAPPAPTNTVRPRRLS